ncbi:NAD+ synthase [Candidatus Caldatribacterium saccharofermentans]|uniref:Glutamine-dependent NAD(+) synthetase n=1 Tax=Candidatus Caldatribacterium saccharofermentans TaxID=1454753 RepID=A0A7V4TJF6_9BACT
MRIALWQMNPTVGDVRGNAEKILQGISWARAQRADLVVFPELSLVGYPPRDLLFREEMLRAVEEVLEEEIRPASQGIGVLLGAPVREEGKLYNSALLFFAGKLCARQDKTLLPNYDIFDEVRYFRSAKERKVVTFFGERLGLTICEDIWNDKDFWSRPRYDLDPLEDLFTQGATLLVNISASPYHFGKKRLRASMLSHIAQKYTCPLVYVNQVGGNDELVFDGSSLVLDAAGGIVWEGKSFAEDCTVIDTEGSLQAKNPSQVCEGIEEVYQALLLGIRDYFRKTGFKKALVGLSGGIDSSVVAALATFALGAENVTGVGMPSFYSSKESLEDAQALAEHLGIEFRVIPIGEIFSAYLRVLNPSGTPLVDLAEENLQARIRGSILMFISNREGYLVLSTGNKSELAMGYCTLYGDMSGGLDVLADVPKTTVYELARYINREREIIPRRVLVKAPSAELRPHQRDEDVLPPYGVLDPILKAYIEDNLSPEDIAALGFDEVVVKEVIRRVDQAEYKRRQAAPGLRVTTKAFGVGRRMPIAWKKGWE